MNHAAIFTISLLSLLKVIAILNVTQILRLCTRGMHINDGYLQINALVC